MEAMNFVLLPPSYGLSMEEGCISTSQLNPLLPRFLKPISLLLKQYSFIFLENITLQINKTSRVHVFESSLDTPQTRLQLLFIRKNVTKFILVKAKLPLLDLLKSSTNVTTPTSPSLVNNLLVFLMCTPSCLEPEGSLHPSHLHRPTPQQQGTMIRMPTKQMFHRRIRKVESPTQVTQPPIKPSGNQQATPTLLLPHKLTPHKLQVQQITGVQHVMKEIRTHPREDTLSAQKVARCR